MKWLSSRRKRKDKDAYYVGYNAAMDTLTEHYAFNRGYQEALDDIYEWVKEEEFDGEWCKVIHSCDLLDEIKLGMTKND